MSRIVFPPSFADRIWNPTSFLSNEYLGEALSSGTKRPGLEADHLFGKYFISYT
jgi:hypothetical protein